MIPEIQEDDEVLGRSLQPAHQPPQLILRQLPEARLLALIYHLSSCKPVSPSAAD